MMVEVTRLSAAFSQTPRQISASRAPRPSARKSAQPMVLVDRLMGGPASLSRRRCPWRRGGVSARLADCRLPGRSRSARLPPGPRSRAAPLDSPARFNLTGIIYLNSCLRHDNCCTASRRAGARRAGSKAARRALWSLGADHPADGGQRRRDPGQRGLAGQAHRGARRGRRRADRGRRGEPCRRPGREIEVNPLQILLAADGALLALVPLSLWLGRLRSGRWITYGGALAICAAAGSVALFDLLGLAGGVADVTLPLGLPWIGARFHLDPLAAVFLVVVNLGGAFSSLYALGYGRGEHEPLRVLPFYPAFLAGMNLVVLASDAFSFLIAWEVMSLASWALVMAHHREAGNARAGYVYLVMASFGALCLLLAFSLLAGPQGAYAFAAMRAH